MKHSKSQLSELAKKILEDIEFSYHKDKDFLIIETKDKYFFALNSKIENGILLYVYWYDLDFLDGMEGSACLTIDDDTGEPEEFSVRSGGGGNWVISKDAEGKYYVSSNY